MGKGINTQQPVIHAIHQKFAYTDFDDASAMTLPIGTIPKGSTVLRTFVALRTAFAPSATGGLSFLIGCTGATGFLVDAGAIAEGTAGIYLIAGSMNAIELTSDLVAFATLTWGSAPTAGEGILCIEFMPPVMNKESYTLLDGNN